MFCIKNNEKNESVVILNPEAGVKISGASVESVVNAQAKTKRYSAKRDLYGDFAYAHPLKMTEKVLSFLRLRGASGAQGISAPASCREAHKRRFIFNLIRRSLEKFFKKNFRDDSSFYFGFAKVTALALFFSLINISESLAVTISCIKGVREDGVTACEKCGDNCDWSISGDTLTITGSGAMTDYKYASDSPWQKDGNLSQVKNLVIDGITRIGTHAFWKSNISKVSMSDTVTEIGAHSFAWSNFSEIKLSDNLEKLEESAFRRTHMPTIVLPADVLIAFDALGDFAPDIVCKGTTDDCKKLYNQLLAYSHNTPEPPYLNIPQDLSQKMQKIKQSQCDSTNYYWSGTDCNNKKNGINCAENWKQNEDFCNRIRYTPAEAAQVLHDDNTNEVIITFKK